MLQRVPYIALFFPKITVIPTDLRTPNYLHHAYHFIVSTPTFTANMN